MPGYDGTGPRGMGRMTGRGLGYCASPVLGRRLLGGAVGGGRGFRHPVGWGRGMGFGRGMRFGRGIYGTYTGPQGPQDVPASPQEELAFLREQASGIEGELKRIQDRIEELS